MRSLDREAALKDLEEKLDYTVGLASMILDLPNKDTKKNLHDLRLAILEALAMTDNLENSPECIAREPEKVDEFKFMFGDKK